MTHDEMISELRAAGHDVSPRPATSHAAMVAKMNGDPPHLRRIAASKTGRLIDAMMAAIAPVIKDHVETKIAAAVAPLLERIAELERRPAPRWAGSYREGEVYHPLSFAVHAGSLWVSTRSTLARPGANGDWTLCCKQGRAQP